MYLTVEQRILAGSDFTGDNGANSQAVTVVAGSDLVQGDKFYLRSTLKPVFIFEFDFTGAFAAVRNTQFHRYVTVDTGMSATEVRDAVIAAINATPSIPLYASSNASDSLLVTNAFGGAASPLPAVPDDVADAGFVVADMSGGDPRPYTDIGLERVFAPASGGGIFDFEFTQRRVIDGLPVALPHSWVVERLFLDCTGATDYTVSVLLPDGTTIVVETGSGGVITMTNIILVGTERLQLVTTGGTLAMVARVTARPRES